MPGVPASEQHQAGYSNLTSNNGTDHDLQTRNFFQADATYYATWVRSSHQIKGGVQIDRRAEDVFIGNLNNVVELYWGLSLNGVVRPFGYYDVAARAREYRGLASPRSATCSPTSTASSCRISGR